MQVYPENAQNGRAEPPPDPHERYGFSKSKLAVTAELPISRYCADNGIRLYRSGAQQVALCPLHQEETPSFTVFGDSSFYCFGCSEWGDVINLHALLDNHSAQWTALVDLAQRYNIELPERPKRWFERQEEKAQLRKGLTKISRDLWKRHYFNAFFRDRLATIPDPSERKEATQRVWYQIDLLSQGVEL